MSSSLNSMLGEAFTGRSRFQWVKLFGKDNLLPPTGKNSPIIIKNEHICSAFYDSKAKGRTTDHLALIMMHTYLVWCQKPANRRITGFIAETIHDNVMRSISNYWKRPWEPDKHKCPIYGIMNLFNLIRSSVQSDYLPPKEGKPIVNKKARYHREMVESAMYSFEQGGNTLKVADTHPVYGWSYYHAQDPLSRLINKEARGED